MFETRKVGHSSSKKSFPWKSTILTSLSLARPLFSWYQFWKKRKAEQKRVTLLKKIIVILLSVLLALGIVAGVAKALIATRIITLSSVVELTGTEPMLDDNGFVNLLLIGQGDDDHDGKDLTDTIIVASIDPSDTGGTALLSLPRDLYFLHTENMGKGKLNTFYRDFKAWLWYQKGVEKEKASIDALREIGDEIGRTLNLDIHGVVKVNFTAFTEAVDLVGGIDIDVPYTIDDKLYPDTNYGYDPFYIEKGMRHLDGATALKYARSRSTTSDFGRSARQQQVIRALSSKAKSEGLHKNPGIIVDFLHLFRENVHSTLSISEMIGLAGLASKLDTSRVSTMQLSDRNGLYGEPIEPGGFLYTPPRDLFDGASVLLPVSIPEFPVTWKQIRTFSELFFKNRAMYLSSPRIAILNNSAPEGSARRLGKELTRYGFDVSLIANASTPETDESFVTTTKDSEDLRIFFATLFDMTPSDIIEILPEDEEEVDVTIILGGDYRYQPFQSLLDIHD